MTSPLDALHYALDAVREGKPVILLDDPDREGEGDLVIAGEHVINHPERLRYHLRFGVEFCVAMPIARLEALGLSQDVYYGKKDPCNTYTRVDARAAHSGISTFDRALAVEALLYDQVPLSHPFSRLETRGHTTPLGAKVDGVLERQGHTEGSLDLVILAGLQPAAILSELKDLETGDPMQGETILSFAKDFCFPVLPIQSLITYRQALL